MLGPTVISDYDESNLESLNVAAFRQTARGAARFRREDRGSQQRPDKARSGPEHRRPGDSHELH